MCSSSNEALLYQRYILFRTWLVSGYTDTLLWFSWVIQGNCHYASLPLMLLIHLVVMHISAVAQRAWINEQPALEGTSSCMWGPWLSRHVVLASVPKHVNRSNFLQTEWASNVVWQYNLYVQVSPLDLTLVLRNPFHFFPKSRLTV
jgi:hypothetical protein